MVQKLEDERIFGAMLGGWLFAFSFFFWLLKCENIVSILLFI